jgi:hypothetical protein
MNLFGRLGRTERAGLRLEDTLNGGVRNASRGGPNSGWPEISLCHIFQACVGRGGSSRWRLSLRFGSRSSSGSRVYCSRVRPTEWPLLRPRRRTNLGRPPLPLMPATTRRGKATTRRQASSTIVPALDVAPGAPERPSRHCRRRRASSLRLTKSRADSPRPNLCHGRRRSTLVRSTRDRRAPSAARLSRRSVGRASGSTHSGGT